MTMWVASVLLVSALVASIVAVPVDDETVQSLLNDFYFAKSKINPQDLELSKVYKTKTWHGFNYKYYFNLAGSEETCEVIIYDGYIAGPEQEILVDSCVTLIKSRNRRADVKDETVQSLLNDFYFPETKINPQDLELNKVHESKTWHGFNYKYYFNLAGSEETCEVILYDGYTAGPTREILVDTCSSLIKARSSRAMSGGWIEKDTSNGDLLGALDNVYFFTNKGVKRDQLGEVQRLEVQVVVGGVNVRYTFNVAGSNQLCQIVIDKQWSLALKVISDTCVEAAVAKRKVPMPGGWMEQDAQDEQFVGILEETFFGQSELGFFDIHLEKIETQVAAGFNIRYSFHVAGTQEDTCSVVIFKKWSGERVITSDNCTSAVQSRGPLNETHQTGDAAKRGVSGFLPGPCPKGAMC